MSQNQLNNDIIYSTLLEIKSELGSLHSGLKNIDKKVDSVEVIANEAKNEARSNKNNIRFATGVWVGVTGLFLLLKSLATNASDIIYHILKNINNLS